MAYEIINEELKIASCRIKDLTMKQVTHFLDQWESGASIGQLTLFYDKEKDLLVLNRDNRDYSLYLDMVQSYFAISDDERYEVVEKSPNSMRETLGVLNNVLLNRRNNKELSILEKQPIGGECFMKYPMCKAIKERYGEKDVTFLMITSFNYGFIQGKRADRARRKAGVAR